MLRKLKSLVEWLDRGLQCDKRAPMPSELRFFWDIL
jgi:hypothetical protein